MIGAWVKLEQRPFGEVLDEARDRLATFAAAQRVTIGKPRATIGRLSPDDVLLRQCPGKPGERVLNIEAPIR